MPPSSAGDRTTTTSRATWASNARVLRQEMPVFLQGRRAFFIYHPCAADIATATPYQSTASPILALPTRAAPIRASPISCFTYFVPLLLSLACPAAAAACHSYPHFAYFAVAAFGYRSTARTAPFYSFAWSAATARAPSAVLRDVAQPIPVPALPGVQKRRTEPHRVPSAAKKQPICRGSITAAGHLALRKIAFSESRYPDTWEYQVITSSEEDSFSI